MKIHNVLMKTLALGAVVVSLSPFANVATVVHADATVPPTHTSASNSNQVVNMNKWTRYFSFKSLFTTKDCFESTHLTYNKNDPQKYRFQIKNNSKDMQRFIIMADLKNVDDEKWCKDKGSWDRAVDTLDKNEYTTIQPGETYTEDITVPNTIDANTVQGLYFYAYNPTDADYPAINQLSYSIGSIAKMVDVNALNDFKTALNYELPRLYGDELGFKTEYTYDIFPPTAEFTITDKNWGKTETIAPTPGELLTALKPKISIFKEAYMDRSKAVITIRYERIVRDTPMLPTGSFGHKENYELNLLNGTWKEVMGR